VATFNVQTYGAVGNGSTNDTTAITSAISAVAAAGGGTLLFPKGTYLVDPDRLFVQSSNTVWLGEGADLSILKGSTTGGQLTQTTTFCQHVTFQGLGFDTSAGNISAFFGYGSNSQRFSFRSCKFTGFQNGTVAVDTSEGVDFELIDCEFHARGQGKGTAIETVDGVSRLSIRGCKFYYCGNGIVVDTASGSTPDEGLAEDVVVSECYFDGAWYFLATRFANSGASVTYLSNKIQDSSAIFTGLVANDVVRAMAVRRSSTITSVTELSLTDSGANFIAAGVVRGEIIRVGSVFGIVSGIQSATTVRVEEWLDAATYLQVAPPAVGATYTAYSVVLGSVSDSTATTITVDRWYDLGGNTVTPANGTRYEVSGHPGYTGIQIEPGARRVRISNNTLKRSWADQISLYGNDNVVADNLVHDGQDMGITVNGTAGLGHSLIIGNKIHHQGSGGIFTSGENALVVANQITATTWVNSVNTIYLAGIILGGNNSRASANLVDGQNATLSRYGICVGSSASGCTVSDNTCRQVTTAGIQLYLSSNTKLRDNDATIAHYTGTAGQDYGVLVGTGSPASTVIAGVGTMFRSSDQGQAFIKKSGTDNSGWQLLPSFVSGTKTWDPPSILDAAQTTTTVTVTGAALGDAVIATFSVSLQALQLTAYVSAANTITVVLLNRTGAAVDLPSGTLRADVWHR